MTHLIYYKFEKCCSCFRGLVLGRDCLHISRHDRSVVAKRSYNQIIFSGHLMIDKLRASPLSKLGMDQMSHAERVAFIAAFCTHLNIPVRSRAPPTFKKIDFLQKEMWPEVVELLEDPVLYALAKNKLGGIHN